MLWGIFGRRKSGKTELTKAASYHLATHGSLVLAHDVLRQWPNEYQFSIREIYEQNELGRLYAFGDCEPDDVAVLATQISSCVFIVDEVDLICGGPRSWNSDAARHVVRRGRHMPGDGVAFFVNGQRFVNCHTDILSLCDRVSVFYMNHPRDLTVIHDWMGPEYADEVQRLEPYYFVTYPDGIVAKIGLNGEPYVQRDMGIKKGPEEPTPVETPNGDPTS